jgi:hypothetical protein
MPIDLSTAVGALAGFLLLLDPGIPSPVFDELEFVDQTGMV